MLIVGIPREQVCAALIVTERALRKWIQLFNEKGIDGLITNKRPGRTAILSGNTAVELTQLIEQPAKAFHGYLSQTYQIECSYQTVVRFFHRQGFALKFPQPWSDRQDEKQRAEFLEKLRHLSQQAGIDLWFADESGFEGDPLPGKRWNRK